MKLIVGLGNPGTQYAYTRHNIGFDVVDACAHTLDVSFTSFKSCAVIGKAIREHEHILLAKPTTFMNNSGIAVQALVQYYHIACTDILVVFDDCSLDLGNIRIRGKGSAGGHNGLQSVIEQCGTHNIARLRIGIGTSTHPDLSSYVLSKFSPHEHTTVQSMISAASQAALAWTLHSTESVMQTINRKNKNNDEK